MKVHCRCRTCKARRKLKQHPESYRLQPKCLCGARDWRKDEYRHRVELVQMSARTGRYKVCHADCFHHSHRAGSTGCKFDIYFNYRDIN